MSTEIPILYNEIKKEFDTALKNAAEGEYVPKPKSLYRYTKLRQTAIFELRSVNQSAKKDLEEKSSKLVQEYGIGKLEAKDIALEVQSLENSLKDQGAFFGNEVFNFAINRPVISKENEQKIVKAASFVMSALKDLGRSDSKLLSANQSMYPIESEFDRNKLSPNAARLDFILTDAGPKIIEVNSQWVDAINALSAFAYVFGDLKTAKNIIEKFTKAFPQNSSLALINIRQIFGSRETGATKELEILSQKILKTNRLRRCEVIDPNKVRLDYIKEFSSFYLNFDPRALGYNKPDWIEFILKRVTENSSTVFPRWRPLLDKKIALTLIPNADGYLVPTIPLSKYQMTNQPIVLKGDGYSLNSVATSYDTDFQEAFDLAQKDSANYIVQPFIESNRYSGWVYDSSSKKIKYIKDGYTKLNVWWFNNDVVGMLATISDSRLISDKGYNVYPLIKD